MNQILTPPLKRLSSANNSENALRVIIFPVSNYLFALPVGAVIKIITCPSLVNTIEDGIGMVNLDDRTLTVVDPSYNFLENSSEAVAVKTDYFANKKIPLLILIETKTEESCGILIARQPILTDISLTTIRPIPLSYRQVAKLDFVTHMAILSLEEDRETVNVFLLAMNQIIRDYQQS